MTIALAGGKDGAGEEFLVGQRCVASVSLPAGWTATAPPSPSTASAYAWSPGGSADPFKESTCIMPTIVRNGRGFRTDLSDVDKKGSTLTCCFAKQGTAQVAATVRAVGPDGTVLNVGASKNASVVRPLLTNTSVTDGVATVVDAEAFMGVVSSSSNTTGQKGFVWTAAVDDGNFVGPAGTHGRWCWTQILDSHTTRTKNGVAQIQEYGSERLGWFTEGIDSIGSLPYPAIDADLSDGWFPANGDPKNTSDWPGIELIATDATSYQAHDQFTDDLMYTPPGEGSQPVPLQSFTWWWQGAATSASGHWSGSGLGQGHGANDSDPAFPSWSHVIGFGPDTFRWRNL